MARAVMNELTVVPFVGVSRIISFIPRSLSLSLPLYLQIIWPLLRSDPAVSSLTLAIIRHSTRHSSAPDGESVTYRNKCGKLNESAISGSGRNR